MNRGPIVLTIDEAEASIISALNITEIIFFRYKLLINPSPTSVITYRKKIISVMNMFELILNHMQYILDQFPPPSSDEDEITTKLRKRFQDLLKSLRTNAEGGSTS